MDVWAKETHRDEHETDTEPAQMTDFLLWEMFIIICECYFYFISILFCFVLFFDADMNVPVYYSK